MNNMYEIFLSKNFTQFVDRKPIIYFFVYVHHINNVVTIKYFKLLENKFLGNKKFIFAKRLLIFSSIYFEYWSQTNIVDKGFKYLKF